MRRLLPRFAAVILAAGLVMALAVAALAVPATMLDHVGSGDPEPLELGPLAQRSYVYAADNSLMATLQGAAVPFDLMVYPGQTHRVGGPKISVHLWRAIEAFLAQHGGVPIGK